MGFLGSIFDKAPKPPELDMGLVGRESAAQAKLDKEKKRALSSGSMGMSSTILTGGQGVTDEANTGRTLLGSY
jgi:hypothetical protein